jgi:PDDEXK-like domain of unknown function (DUF3799)
MNGSITSRMPMDEYQGLAGTSITRLKELKRSPLHYRHRLAVPLESSPLALGTAAHCAVLEPERFADQFAVWSRRSETTGTLCPRNGKWWEAFQLENAGKTIITEDECTAALGIGAIVRADPIAGRYLASGEPEVVLQWDAHGRACKGRIDWLTHLDDPVLVGLKTTRDCRAFIFGAQAAKLDYPLQWAWYFNGYSLIKGVRPRVVEIVVESAPPHAVAVYTINEDILLKGEEEYLRLLPILAECEAAGVWPGPATDEQLLTLPTWYYGPTADDISELELEA